MTLRKMAKSKVIFTHWVTDLNPVPLAINWEQCDGKVTYYFAEVLSPLVVANRSSKPRGINSRKDTSKRLRKCQALGGKPEYLAHNWGKRSVFIGGLDMTRISNP